MIKYFFNFLFILFSTYSLSHENLAIVIGLQEVKQVYQEQLKLIMTLILKTMVGIGILK